MKILIVDDEPGIIKFLKAGLASDYNEIYEATTAAEAISSAATNNPDIILLDLGLPDADGLKVIERIREWSQTPIIVLSARDKENDKIKALDSGADDYLTKPFSNAELKARIRTHLRRSTQRLDLKTAFSFGDIEVDLAGHVVKKAGAEVHLTPIEFQLLNFLIQHADKVVPHKLILKNVWGEAYSRQTQYLRVFMANLRQKLEDNPTQPKYFINEPGIGYRLAVGES